MTRAFNVKLSFAASGTASGLVGNGVSYFLLLYYSQVLGLDRALAGLALMIALVVDAVSDPLVGKWSDHLRHKLGRRHPFLYVAILPAALCYYFLRDVPELSQTQLFFYLLVLIVGLRLALTMHVVPFNALLPEVAKDYDYRTQLMNVSYSSSWFLGTLMAVAMYVWWLADSVDDPDGTGILRAEGYVEAGLVAGVGIFICLLVAAAGTRHLVPTLSAGLPAAGSLRQSLRQAAATLSDRSFFALVASGVFGAAASGTSTALWAYMQPYFWGFESSQTSVILFAQLSSAAIAFYLTPWITSGREKRNVLIVLMWVSLLFWSGPVLLASLDWFVTAAWLFSTMLVIGVLQVTLVVMTSTLSASMLADLVEARERVTGRREEGLLYSVQSFVGKVASGVGVWAGGLILAFSGFSADSATQVQNNAASALGWWFVGVISMVYITAIASLSCFVLTRASHEQNLRALAQLNTPQNADQKMNKKMNTGAIRE